VSGFLGSIPRERRHYLIKKGDVLKVLERHGMLTLAMQRQIIQREATQELYLSYISKLIKRLREAGGGCEPLFY